MKKSNKRELILEVGAAGGSISVWSVKAKGGLRSFLIIKDETTLKEFMTKEDAAGLTFKSETGPLHSFADALTALGSYPWHRLYPLFVHHDFIDPILAEVKKLGGKKEVDRWQDTLERSKPRV